MTAASPLGIFARVFPTQPAQTLAATIAGHGFDCVQLNLVAVGLPTIPAPTQLPELALQQVGEAFAAVDVEVWGLSATYNMAHPDPQRRQHDTVAAAALVAAAGRVGAHAVSLCTGTRDPDNQWCAHPDNTTDEAWADMIASFGPLLDAAEECGVLLAVEPEPANIVADVDQAVRLVDALGGRSDQIGFILDAANLVADHPTERRAAVLTDAFDRLGAQTICLHAKDVVSWSNRLAGTAGLDFELIAELRRGLANEVPLVIQDTTPEQVAPVVELLTRAAAVSR